MFERLEESTRVPDVRGVLTVASAYAAIGAAGRVWGGALVAVLAPAAFLLAAGWFAVRGGRRWVRETAWKSAVAAGAGLSWILVETWPVDSNLLRMFAPAPRMEIETLSCFGGPEFAVWLVAIVLTAVAGGIGSVPVGWASRRLLLLRHGGVDE